MKATGATGIAGCTQPSDWMRLLCRRRSFARIMKEEGLIAKRPTKRKYSSYKGEISEAPENLVARDFYADDPNLLWLTDITEFSIPAGKIYLSSIIDCFDGMCIAWSQSTSPNADLVNSMVGRCSIQAA